MTLELRLEVIEADEPLVTTCAFSVFFDDVAIWPVRGVDDASLEIQIDDLLSHLSEFWKPLMLRQTYPLSLNPLRPTEMCSAARERWADASEEQVEEEDEVLEAFRNCHDLSRCFAGYFDLPPLWFVRSGEEMQVDTGGEMVRVDFAGARAALEKAGDWVASRLDAMPPARWHDLLAAWRNRDAGDGIDLLRLSTGLDEETVRQATERGFLAIPISVAEAANDNDELRLAARMASALPAEAVQTVLERAVRFPPQSAERLTTLAARIKAHIAASYANAWPFRQGEELARVAREWLLTSGEDAVDVFSVVRDLGVDILLDDLNLPTLDALAIWGARHGPAVLLNSGSQRHLGQGMIEERGAVRVTLAHELCHFLIDGEHALGAVEVLQSRMPVAIEQRARAFAAEFLLPTQLAARKWDDANRPLDRCGLEDILDRLCDQFKISKSVASWKLEHGARQYGANVQRMLALIVPQR